MSGSEDVHNAIKAIATFVGIFLAFSAIAIGVAVLLTWVLNR